MFGPKSSEKRKRATQDDFKCADERPSKRKARQPVNSSGHDPAQGDFTRPRPTRRFHTRPAPTPPAPTSINASTRTPEQRERQATEHGVAHEPPRKAPRQDTFGSRRRPCDSTTSPFIYKLPAEMALRVFSHLEDTDVAKSRFVSRWFRSNISDRFAEFCIDMLKKREYQGRKYDLSFTPESLEKLWMISTIPRVGQHFTELSINPVCLNKFGVAILGKMYQEYIYAARGEEERALVKFKTFKKVIKPAAEKQGVGIYTALMRKKWDYEQRFLEHKRLKKMKDWQRMMTAAFKNLENLQIVRLDSMEDNPDDVAYLDIRGLCGLNVSDHLDLPAFMEGCASRAMAATITAVAKAGLKLQTFGMTPSHQPYTSLGVTPSSLSPKRLRESLSASLSNLRALNLTLERWPDFSISSEGFSKPDRDALTEFLQAAATPSLRHLGLTIAHPAGGGNVFEAALLKTHCPKLSSIVFTGGDVQGDVFADFLLRHKDSLRWIELDSIQLTSGSWECVFKLLRDHLALEWLRVRDLRQSGEDEFSVWTVYFNDLCEGGEGRALRIRDAVLGKQIEQHTFMPRYREQDVRKGLDQMARHHKMSFRGLGDILGGRMDHLSGDA